MIENPEITLKILRIYARDETPWPANYCVEDIVRLTDDFERNVIEYHLICAIKSELLQGSVNKTSTLDGNLYTFGYIDGLTAKGSEYVCNSENPEVWNKAKDYLISAGLKITTDKSYTAVSNVVQNITS